MKNLLRKKLAALFAMADTQPYSREVESIKSEYTASGNVSYIDTGIFPGWDEDFEMVATITKTEANRALPLSNYSGVLTFYLEMTATNRLRFGSQDSTSIDPSFESFDTYTSGSYNIPLNVPTKIWLKYTPRNDSSNAVDYEVGLEALDGSVSTKSTGTCYRSGSPSTSSRTLRFFHDYRSSATAFNGGFKIHQLEIKHGSIHKKYIACLDKENVPCFYEAISKKLAYNDGSGNFTAGKEIHPVEYIVFDGTQRFNSGFYPNTLSTTLKTTIALTSSDSLGKFPFGVRKISGYGDSCAMYIAPSSSAAPYGYLRLDWPMQNGTDRYKFKSLTEKVTIEGTGNYAKVNDEEFTATVVTSFDHPATFYVGNCYTENSQAFQSGFIGQLWNLSLLNTTSRIPYRDFIAAVDEKAAVFLYDKANHAVFTKATGNEFVISVNGVEYTPADYLESTGTQYILSGVYPTENTGIEVEYAYPTIDANVDAGVCGTYQGTAPRTDACFVTTNSGKTNSKLLIAQGGVAKNTGVAAVQDTWYNVKINWLNDGVLNLNDGQVTDSVGTNGVENDELVIFGRTKASDSSIAGGEVRIRKYRISEKKKITHEFIAAVRKSDSVAGMLDLIDGSFHTNAGTGDFTVGARS